MGKHKVKKKHRKISSCPRKSTLMKDTCSSTYNKKTHLTSRTAVHQKTLDKNENTKTQTQRRHSQHIQLTQEPISNM